MARTDTESVNLPFVFEKGKRPLSSKHRSTPKLHMSAGLADHRCITSGAMNTLVPNLDMNTSPRFKKPASPKSASLTMPAESSSMFSGLMSLCTTPATGKRSTADPKQTMIGLPVEWLVAYPSSGNGPQQLLLP